VNDRGDERVSVHAPGVGDLLEIWSFISKDKPEAAERVEAAIFRACDLLVNSPLAGTTRKDITPLPVRFWVLQPYSSYLIVYDPKKKPLQIIRILHTAHDLPSVLI
jgi:plasmid stabilization system protein ParE